MGDPRKIRKKYEGPSHPWIASRIAEEKELTRNYGTKAKRELYKMDSALKRFKDQAKALSSRFDAQAEKERAQMVDKMVSLGLVKPGAGLDEILSLSIQDLMNRRLQTVMVKNLLARTPSQARQFVTHGHVLVDGNIITSPSYFVRVDEESKIGFRTRSPFNSEQHPERFSESELKAKDERDKQKSAKTQKADDEAPLVFDDIEDPESLTKVAAKKPKVEAKTEEKAEKKTTEVSA